MATRRSWGALAAGIWLGRFTGTRLGATRGQRCPPPDASGKTELLPGPGRHRVPGDVPISYAAASLAAFTGRALMIFRAGFVLKVIGSLVKGLMPLRALVAGFLTTTNLAKPGTRNAPVRLISL